MHIFASTIVVIILVLLQTTLMHHLAIEGVIPDLSLIAIVFLANKNGKMLGETSGFVAGLVEDFLSLSPLGFHSFVKTVIGFLFGYTKGVVFIGTIFMPVVMTAAATFLKFLLVGILKAFFQMTSLGLDFFSWPTLIEFGYNMLLSPFIFAILGLFKFLLPKER